MDTEPLLANMSMDLPPGIAARVVAEAIHTMMASPLPGTHTLEALAARAGYSPFHFQRLFLRYTGISPKRFSQFLTLTRAKGRLAYDPGNLLDVALDLGLSGPSRLYDLFVTCEAMTPAGYRAAAASLTLDWGVHHTPLGRVLLASTSRGLCWLSFVQGGDVPTSLGAFQAAWPRATFRECPTATARWASALLMLGDPSQAGAAPLPVLLKGTAFQLKVWRALLDIPPGTRVSYGALARAIGHPTAARAVGHAVGQNPVAWLIPCHRVIHQSGALDAYRWGAEAKRTLLAWEAARFG